MKRVLLFIAIISLFAGEVFGADINITGWQLKQYNASQTYTFGSITVPGGGYVIICRGKKKADFETYYGVTLGANVQFIDSTFSMPQINGLESYTLYNSSAVLVDSTNISVTALGIYYRDSTNMSTFSRVAFATTSATPGSLTGTVANKNKGIVVTEVCDASNYFYEYIEIYNDTGIASNTAPVITLLAHDPAIVGAGEAVTVSANISDNGTIAYDTCFFKVNSGAWSKMTHSGLAGNVYSYSIGTFAASDTVNYYIKAIDNLATATFSDTNSFIVTAPSSGNININGWQLKQYNSAQTYTFGDITIPAGGYVIICRGKLKADFETYYGVTLGSNVTFIDSTYSMPNINGGEVYSLLNASASLVDSTFFVYSSGGTYYRDSTNANTFTRIVFATNTATPGSTGSTIVNKGRGLVISEAADASDFLYEYVEIYNDTLGVANTSIASVTRTPFIPLAGQVDTIKAKITSPSGLKTVKLITSAYDSSDIDTYNMVAYSGDTLFRYILPGRSNDCSFVYYVEVLDSLNNLTASPAGKFFWGYTSIPTYKENTSDGYAKWYGYNVRATGIVTVATRAFNPTQNIINFQQNYILGAVWKNDSIKVDESETVLVGDSIIVEGTIIFSNGQTRIGNPYSSLTKISSGHSVDTILVTADDLADTVGDKYEGLLIQINALSKKSGTWPTTGENALIVMNEQIVKGGKAIDTFLVWIDSDTDIDESTEPIWPRKIIGVLTQYDITTPYWSMYEIYPRAYLDMATLTAMEECFVSASVANGFITIKWNVSGVDNISAFRIERRFAGEEHYTILANVPSGQTEYKDKTSAGIKSAEYRVTAITADGSSVIFNPIKVSSTSFISSFKIALSSSTFKNGGWVTLLSPEKKFVDINILDMSGRVAKKLYKGETSYGEMNIYIDAKDIPSGIYIIKDNTNNVKNVVRFSIVK